MAEAETISPAEEHPEVELPERRLLLFDIGGGVFACDMAAVREIIPFQRITRLPGAPPAVCGLINLRGTIVTVLDLGIRVGKKPCNRESGSILLVPYNEKLVGVGVDEVRDLQSVRAGEVDQEGNMAAFDARIILGLAEVEGELAVILDIHQVVRDILGKGGES
jgi:purine-binding chemotaxis protein CheW